MSLDFKAIVDGRISKANSTNKITGIILVESNLM